jgi:hypothetical protein
VGFMLVLTIGGMFHRNILLAAITRNKTRACRRCAIFCCLEKQILGAVGAPINAAEVATNILSLQDIQLEKISANAMCSLC